MSKHNNWTHLCKMLQQSEEMLPIVYDKSIPLPDDPESLLHTIAAIDELLKDECDIAISHWISGEGWPHIDKQTNEVLRMRIRAAITFALEHLWPDDTEGTSLIPFPDVHVSEVMTWLLTDWWYAHGRISYAQDSP